MKVNQIANVLNDSFKEIVGETELVTEDLSNVVSVGQKILSSTTYGDNINKATKSIFDKVGQTLYYENNLNNIAFPIYATDAEYGSILEKIRILPTQYEVNQEWNFTENGSSTFNDMFGYHPANVSAKYFNGVSTFRTKPLTLSEIQLRSAFTSREGVYRYMGAIEQTYISQVEFSQGDLTRKTVAGLMGEKIKNKNGIVNLLTLYKEFSGDTKITAAGCWESTEFWKFATKTYRMYLDFLSQPTVLFNTDGYINSTNGKEVVSILLTDFVRSMETYLYSGIYNPEYIKLPSSYTITSSWQGIGTTLDYNSRSQINIVPPSVDTSDMTDDEKKAATITQKGVVGVIFDKRACMVNAPRPETGVQPNNFDKWINYIWMYSAGWFVDSGENAVVFIIADDTTESDGDS